MKKVFILFSMLGFFSLSSVYALEVQGHRGARWVRPENTIPAFEYALQVGVNTLELDTLVTKDGKVVVYHDQTLNSSICLTADGKKIKKSIPIRSLTLKELKSYDCGTLVNPRFPDQVAQPKTSIPTLEEVFDWVKKSKHASAEKVLFNIEAKSDPRRPEFSPEPAEFVKLILEEVKKHGLLKRVTLQSFDFRCLKAARDADSNLSLSLLLADRPSPSVNLVDLMKKYKAQILSPNFKWITAQDITHLHQIGVRVIPWTANTRKDWQSLIQKGVDGIITDNPKDLLDYLKEKGITTRLDINRGVAIAKFFPLLPSLKRMERSTLKLNGDVLFVP